jgi:hypothetical protein
MHVFFFFIGWTIRSHGYPPCANILTSASNALDTRRVRHHVHKPVSPPRWLPRPTAPRSTIILVYVYTIRVFSAFFRKGQVLETFRGEGIYQPAVDLAIEKLRAGAWVRVAFVSFRFSSTRADELYRFTCLERVKFVNPIRTKRIRKLGWRDCSASGGAWGLKNSSFVQQQP